MSDVELSVTDGIATILLNRPDALNAFTDEMESGLIAALDSIDQDDDAAVTVITGAGRAFCAGMDLGEADATFESWRSSPTAPPGTQYAEAGQRLPVRLDGGGRVALRMFESTTPIIAAINGAAVGVGATMTLAADVRLAADRARFGFVFNRLGLVPESCSSWFLPRLVGMQTALEWVLTGRLFSADEALGRGLVRSVHGTEDLLPAATALAAEIRDNTAPVSAALSRRMLWYLSAADHPMAAHVVETLALNERGMSDDAAEGISSFLAKRSPAFPDSARAARPRVAELLAGPDLDPSELHR